MKHINTYIAVVGTSIMLSSSLIACGSVAGNSDIGKDKAEEIALNDAGITREDTSRFRISKDLDDGLSTYDVQFTYDNMEYEYEIQASDGTILDSSTELSEGVSASAATDSTSDSTSDSTPDTPDTSSAHKNASNGMTWEEAAALALERVSGATQNDLRMTLDFDDGYETYEGDIIYNQVEYEFEIDAATGKFLEWSEEKH